jgi:hypothetical protein
MFKCQKCSKSAERPTRIVTERKMVTHRDGNQGSQIVKEISICPDCITVTPEAYKPERIVIEPAPKKVVEAVAEDLDTNHAA